ncbi:MAG TPA: hypothetical protein VIL74_23950 [Pyrinomonadaceae bacterium]|jgi:hypothetical protein
MLKTFIRLNILSVPACALLLFQPLVFGRLTAHLRVNQIGCLAGDAKKALAFS